MATRLHISTFICSNSGSYPRKPQATPDLLVTVQE